MAAGAWRGFSGKTPIPLWGVGFSSEGRKQTLVTVNVSARGKTWLAGRVLGTICFEWFIAWKSQLWQPQSLWACLEGGVSMAFFSLGAPNGGLLNYVPSSHFRPSRNFSCWHHLYNCWLAVWLIAREMVLMKSYSNDEKNLSQKKFTNFLIQKPHLQYLGIEI